MQLFLDGETHSMEKKRGFAFFTYKIFIYFLKLVLTWHDDNVTECIPVPLWLLFFIVGHSIKRVSEPCIFYSVYLFWCWGLEVKEFSSVKQLRAETKHAVTWLYDSVQGLGMGGFQ
jgi:hypothetical protein